MSFFKYSFYSLMMSMIGQTTWALDGSNDVFLAVPAGESTGWKTFEIVSASDDVDGFVFGGKWDGLGAYRADANTVNVFINHEFGPGGNFSRLELNVANLKDWIVAGTANNGNSGQVTPAGDIVEGVSLGWTSVDSNATDPIYNPCSGNVWLADTFGEDRGFADGVYLVGEETFNNAGHIWVMDLATRTLYEAYDLSSGSWENATLIDTGRTDTVALLLSEDLGSSVDTGNAWLRLYVGLKNSSGDFLERNGLSGGTVYYWDPDGTSTAGTMNGIFSGGNGTVISGEWSTYWTDAARFSKSEDLHTNMNKDSIGYGKEVALAAQEQGVFIIDFSTVDFVAGALGTNKTSEVTVLFEAGTQDPSLANDFSGMDNLVWSADGKIYVNEDDGEGDIWLIDPASLKASFATGDYTPDTTQVYSVLDADDLVDPTGYYLINESSGIIDISKSLDYQPGSIFLCSGQSEQTIKNQLAMAVSPSAQLLSAAYTEWIAEFPVSDASQPADPDMDGIRNDIEFALDTAPDQTNASPPLQLVKQPSHWDALFTPGRSLNIVSYELEYTEDLTQEFDQSMPVSADMIDNAGNVTIELPPSEQLFIQLKMVIP